MVPYSTAMPRRAVRLAHTWRFAAFVALAWAHGATAAPAAQVIAVIDGTGDADGMAAATRIGEAISADDGLAALADPAATRALIAPLGDEDAAVIADARAALEQAGDALARFDDATALGQAATGQTRLREAAPRPLVTALLADLVFTEGLARRTADADGARVAFAEVHRLDPGRKLEAAHFLPDLIAAYESAGRAAPATGSIAIEVDGPGTEVWIDGVRVGAPPLTATVADGIHFVTVTGLDAVTTGARVRVDAGKTAPLRLTAIRADVTTRLARLRRRLLEASDDAARATAIHDLAAAVGTGVAVVVVRRADGLGTRVWRDRAPGLGPVAAFTTGPTAPHDVLAPFVQAKEPEADRLPRIGKVELPPELPWWKTSWFRNSAAIGAVVVVGAIITYAVTRDPGSSRVEGIGFNPGGNP